MLFNSLYAPESGVDIIQVVGTLDEDLDPDAFRRACAQLVQRHPILRTAFRWAGLPQPVQEVAPAVPPPLELLDWRAHAPAEQQAELQRYLRADRLRGFALTTPPLLRLTLIRLAETRHHLIFTFHHAILDGRSLLLLLRELFALHEAEAAQRTLALTQPRPYADYIAWLEQLDRRADERFWRDLLAGFHEPTRLLVERQAVSDAAAGAVDQQFLLTAETTAALSDLATAHQLTLSTIVQGAWALLLSRYSGQDDVVFGVTRSCRRGTIDGADDMIGLFINTLPLRARLDPALPLIAWLQQLRAQNRVIRDHQHAPLMQVQQWSETPHGAPLFNSIVVFEKHVLDSALRSSGDAWQRRTFDLVRQPNYPLALGVFGGPRLLCRIIYDQQRYDHATIRRMLGQLEALLAGIAAQPERRLGEIGLLTAAELHEQLVAWNSTAAPLPPPLCLHQAFEAWAARQPEAVAVVGAGRTLSYGELDRRANQLARHLREAGIGPERCVGLLAERSPELAIGILGILKAGAAYVPLDPAYPAERLQFMLADSQAPLLLTERALAERLPWLAEPLAAGSALLLDADWPRIAQQPDAPLSDPRLPEQLAYVIYTSGSTGRPKGVACSHRGVINLLDDLQRRQPLAPGDHGSLWTSLSFDVSVYEIFAPLTAGGALHLIPEELRADGPALIGWLQHHQITSAYIPPALLHELAAWLDAGHTPPPLRRLLVGVEPIPEPLLRGMIARIPGLEIINGYGPTEASICATLHRVDPASTHQGITPIGRPVQHMPIYLLDRQLQPVPVGVPGELYIAGLGLARGYHNRRDLTAERFVPNPFGHEDFRLPILDFGLGADSDSIPNPKSKIQNAAVQNLKSKIQTGSRLYKTGDLARYRPDGQIEFVGRIDDQVKLRGYRIELGEIVAALAQHPAVAEAVVIVRDDRLTGGSADKRLVAYIVSRDQGSRMPSGRSDQAAALDVEALRSFLRERLPDYMIPSAFVQLDTLPLTANGKLDRQALPAPSQPQPAAAYTPPRTPIEELLLGIWAQTLGLSQRSDQPPLGVHDQFFALGGHSLLAIQTIFKIREVFGADLTVRDLFEAPTIAEFAQRIEQAQRRAHAPPSPAIVRLDRNRHRSRAL